MNYKARPACVKATVEPGPDRTDAEKGQFDAIVSVFGNVDEVGDIVMPGAYMKSLAAWATSPDTLPVLWRHRVDDPRFNIGAVVEADELKAGDSRIPDWADLHVKAHGGLWVKAQLDTTADTTSVAWQAAHLLKTRRVTQFSFAYDVAPGGQRKSREGFNELHELVLHEVSLAPLPVNPLTELGSAKAPTAEQAELAERTFWSDPASIRTRCALALHTVEHSLL